MVQERQKSFKKGGPEKIDISSVILNDFYNLSHNFNAIIIDALSLKIDKFDKFWMVMIPELSYKYLE